jgi:hypothetical protein
MVRKFVGGIGVAMYFFRIEAFSRFKLSFIRILVHRFLKKGFILADASLPGKMLDDIIPAVAPIPFPKLRVMIQF